MTNKQKSLRNLGIALVAVILINLLASFFPVRIDLTADERFTLSDPTKELLTNLDDVVYFDVLLSGDLPSDYKRMQIAIEEMLDSWEAYAGDNIDFRFTDIFSEISDQEQLNNVLTGLKQKGAEIRETGIISNDEIARKRIIPSILVGYGEREVIINLLPQENGNPQSMVQKGVSLLEYNLASAVYQLKNPSQPKVAILQGHGELNEAQTFDMAKALVSRGIEIEYLDLDARTFIPRTFSAIIINKPSQKFTDQDKFKLDQYIMAGGNALWAIDPVIAELDSLMFATQADQGALTQTNTINLEDLFFTYGARVNKDFVQDIKCNGIPLMKGNANKPTYYPWYFYPIIYPDGTHPIVKYLDPIQTQFPASIDTIQVPGIQKTHLLKSSDASRLVFHPQQLRLSLTNLQADPEIFNKQYIPIATLLEGDFPSLFKNRPTSQFLSIYEDSLGLDFREKSVGSKQIIIADGDIFKNEVRGQQAGTMNQYKYNPRARFANRDFFLNCIDYLLDNSGLIAARTNEYQIRPLNYELVEEEKGSWQWKAILFPLILLWIPAIIFVIWRVKRYSKL